MTTPPPMKPHSGFPVDDRVHPTFEDATVVGTNPLRIVRDGDENPLPYEPDSIVSVPALKIGDRVRVENFDGRLIIHGVAGGIAGGGSNVPVMKVNRVVLLADATYNPPATLLYGDIEVLSGAGGGGGRTAGTNTWSIGGGGQAGAYKRIIMSKAQMGASVAVKVGAAGLGVAGAKGANGGDSSFGAFATCTGGEGGATINGANNAALQAAGGSAGGVVGGTVAGLSIPGTPGGIGRVPYNSTNTTTSINLAIAGAGASCIYGIGGMAPAIGQSGFTNDGTGYGAGGTGIYGSNQGPSAGGSGTQGIVIITEYLADTSTAVPAYDTGLISDPTGIFAIGAGWTLNSFSARKVGQTVSFGFDLTFTGTAVTVPATGNITNQAVGTVAVGWRPLQSSPLLGTTTGGLTAGSVNSLGAFTINSVAPGSTFASGLNFTIAGTYLASDT